MIWKLKVESFACCPIALYCNIYIFMADPCDLEVEHSFLLWPLSLSQSQDSKTPLAISWYMCYKRWSCLATSQLNPCPDDEWLSWQNNSAQCLQQLLWSSSRSHFATLFPCTVIITCRMHYNKVNQLTSLVPKQSIININGRYNTFRRLMVLSRHVGVPLWLYHF